MQRTNRAFPARPQAHAHLGAQVGWLVSYGPGVNEHRAFPVGGTAFEPDGALPLQTGQRQIAAGRGLPVGQGDANAPVAVAAHAVVTSGQKQLSAGQADALSGHHGTHLSAQGQAPGTPCRRVATAVQWQVTQQAGGHPAIGVTAVAQRGAAAQLQAQPPAAAGEGQAVKVAQRPGVVGAQGGGHVGLGGVAGGGVGAVVLQVIVAVDAVTALAAPDAQGLAADVKAAHLLVLELGRGDPAPKTGIGRRGQLGADDLGLAVYGQLAHGAPANTWHLVVRVLRGKARAAVGAGTHAQNDFL